jgi:tRNA threonylcarbamoyladenosine biosynthesis protein TsaE
MEAETSSAEETERAGAALARSLRPGDVVLVSGELGAGKTTLVRGALRELGVTEPVTSPTFVVGFLYESARGTAAHLDLYRLSGLEGEDPALLEDYLTPDAIAFVEWPAAASGRLRRPALEVRMRHGGGERREIELDSASSRA